MNGTVRERMCLCMYATDPHKPWLERDIRFRSFLFTHLRPRLSASLFSSGPALDFWQVLQPDGSNSRALRIRFCFPVRRIFLRPEVNRTGLPFSANGQKVCFAVPLLLS